MSSIFNNAKITHIIAFDLALSEFDTKKLESLVNITFFGIDSSIGFDYLNLSVYDREYVERSPKLLTIKFKFGAFTLIKYNSYLKNEINIAICFDQCGINSVRFDFDLKEPVDVPTLIKIVDKTADWADSCLFNRIKNRIVDLFSISTEKTLLKVHSTYSVVSSTDANINSSIIEKEIFGIIWNIKKYKTANNDLIKKVMENSLPIYQNDIVTIAEPAALMLFPKKKKKYVNERINAIEIHQRQKHLLKKLDFELDEIMKRVEEKEKINLNSAIEEIENTQIEIQSALEIYRNTRISATTSFIMLFDILNDVFRLNKQYKFIQEKLNACEKIYGELHAEQRNRLMERIEWIVLIVGIDSLILLIITDVIYGGSVSAAQAWNAVIPFVSVFTICLILVIYVCKNYKRGYQWLNEHIMGDSN